MSKSDRHHLLFIQLSHESAQVLIFEFPKHQSCQMATPEIIWASFSMYIIYSIITFLDFGQPRG